MRSEMLLDVLIVIIVVALRLLSVGFNVTLPGAVERHRVYLPSESRYLKRPVIHPHADTVDPGDTTKDEEDKPQDGSRPPQATVFKEVHLAFCRMLTAFKEVPEARNAEYKCRNDGVYSWFFPYSVPL